jgi:hypothetical protein
MAAMEYAHLPRHLLLRMGVVPCLEVVRVMSGTAVVRETEVTSVMFEERNKGVSYIGGPTLRMLRLRARSLGAFWELSSRSTCFLVIIEVAVLIVVVLKPRDA